MTVQGVALLEVSCGCRTGLGFASPTECGELEGKPEFHRVVLKTPEGGTHAKTAKAAPSPSPNLEERKATQYPFMSLWSKKSRLRLFKKSQGLVGKCCPVQVAKCSQDERAKLHLSTIRGCKDRMVQPKKKP